MKTDVLFSWVFGFIVLATILLTLHEYVQFKIKQHLKKRTAPLLHPTEGKYFELFVPHPMRAGFERRLKAFQYSVNPQNKKIEKFVRGAFVLVLFLISVQFVRSQYHLLFKPVDLDPDEVKNLSIQSHSFSVADEFSRQPAQTSVFSLKQEYVILKSRQESSDAAQSRMVKEEIETTQNWMKKIDVRHRNCYWESLDNCSLNAQKNVLVVQSGYWDEKGLTSLLQKGYALLIVGAPLSVIDKKVPDGFETKILGMTFIKFRHFPEKDYSWRISADRRLTLGLPAGQLVHQAKPTGPLPYYKVQSVHGEAYGVDQKHPLSNSDELRLQSGLLGEGRWVWTNAVVMSNSDEAENKITLQALEGNVLRFLEKKPYQSIAHWPKNARFATHFEQDTEDQFKASGKVLSIFKKHDVPVTWYMLSEEAERNRHLAKEMARYGEVGCHGDNHDVFPDGSLFRQAYRLAKCKKTLTQLVGRVPAGFRPPEEKFNTDTYSASVNTGFEYVFNLFDGVNAAPRILASAVDNKTLVLLPRLTHDDYVLWALKKSPKQQSVETLQADLEWMENLGGLFAFSFHTQSMLERDQLEVLDNLLTSTKAKQPFMATGSELAQWWKYRSRLLIDANQTDPELHKKFQPYVLSVNEDGAFSASPL